MARSVAELCEEHRLTVEGLTERSGLDNQRVLAIVLGRWTPSPAERDAIAAVFGLPRDEIAWGHKTPIQHIYGHALGSSPGERVMDSTAPAPQRVRR
jgi:transcriptional regulator with XRE-family HTH domain